MRHLEFFNVGNDCVVTGDYEETQSSPKDIDNLWRDIDVPASKIVY